MADRSDRGDASAGTASGGDRRAKRSQAPPASVRYLRSGRRSVREAGSEPSEGASAAYVCGYSDEAVLPAPFPGERPAPYTQFELFLRGLRVAGGAARCLGYREPAPSGPYRWLTYEEVRSRVVALGDALVREMGLSRGDRVGIYGKNTKEWLMTALACASQGLVPVPVYDSLGANAAEYVVAHSGLRVLFSSAENLDKAVNATEKSGGGGGDEVRLVVLDSNGGGGGDGRETFDSLAARGDPNARVPATSEETLSELMVIMYTSGTTGTPKGVMLKNEALVSEVAALNRATEAFEISITSSDVLFSYLPLAHIFELAAETLWLASGASIGYYCGDVKRMLDDVAEVRPTVFLGVPRVFSRFHDKVTGTVNQAGAVKRWLFNTAYAAQSANVRRHTRSWLWDALVFKKLRAKLFPHVRLFFSGAAPLPEHLNVFMRTVFCAPTIQGYGLTETTAGVFVAAPSDAFDSVGSVMACAQFKLVDIDEMKYTHRDKPCARGELWLRGPVVTGGYYRSESATREVMPADDGWMATGDVGRLNADGTLSIIDRKKNIFKLAQGEYVAVEVVEAEYLKTRGVGQLWVYGSSLKTQLVAVVVPDPEQLRDMGWLKKDEQVGTLSQARRSELQRLLLGELKAQAKASKLKGYEVIKSIRLETELNEQYQGFSIENDCLTPTFKLKRPQLQERYRREVEQMYHELGE